MFTWTKGWKTVELPVVGEVMTLMWRHSNVMGGSPTSPAWHHRHPGDSQLKVIECFTGDGDYHTELHSLDTLRPRQYGRHFADDIFNWIFLKENVWFLLKFHWGLGFTEQYSGIGSDNGLATTIVAVTCFISSIKSCLVLCFTIMSSIDSVLLLKVLFRQAWRPTYVRMNWALSFVHIIARWRLFHGKSLPEPMSYCQLIIKPWW